MLFNSLEFAIFFPVVAAIYFHLPEYIEMQALTANRREIFERYQNLAKRFGVPLWDYSGSAISSRRENFYNSQHLNAQGAAEFSKDLAARIACVQVLATSSLVDFEQCGPSRSSSGTGVDG